MGIYIQFINLILGYTLVVNSVQGRPFLYDANQSLSFIVSSSSATTQPSNILDLRKSKTKHLEKFQISDDSDQHVAHEGTNEALLGVFQKKIAKIFSKLQLISKLSHFNNVDNEYDDDDDDEEKDTDKVNEIGDNQTTETYYKFTAPGKGVTEHESTTQKFGKIIHLKPIPVSIVQLEEPVFKFPRVIKGIVDLAYKMISKPFDTIKLLKKDKF